jgi:glutaminyl-tRNA synthetase
MSTKKTRFPPEPNGFLHIGHLKAMMKNFNDTDECILRFDDTNPATEKKIYVDAIKRDVDWFGFKYLKITYTSDYFLQLYRTALSLIDKDLAYIDSSTSEEIKEQRKNAIPSPDRDRPIEETKKIFLEMKDGEHTEGSYVLRLKIDYCHPNTSMRDPVAYRINYTPHYRTNRTWNVYPSYDFSHGLCDSFEEITHSYCTREFYIRRKQYYWIIEQLGLHRPLVEEFDRLVIEDVLLSKRKILKSIADGTVDNFDDPNLFTISGLRNRGYTPESLMHFVSKYVAYTTSDSSVIPLHKFNFAVREYFNEHCKRRFAVIDPLKVTIVNPCSTKIIRPDDSNPLNKVGREVPVSDVIYIESTDFKEDHPEKKYKRLAPGKEIRLKYLSVAEYVDHDDKGVSIKLLDKKKCKGAAIHWVSEKDMVKHNMFDPTTKITRTILTENMDINDNDIVQFERLGYYKYTNDTFMFINGLKDSYNTR